MGIGTRIQTDPEDTTEIFYTEAALLFFHLTKNISPQQGDLKLSGLPSGQGAGGGAQTCDRRIPADIKADSLATVLPTFPRKVRHSATPTYFTEQ
ncbi:hypothetical protein PoB_006588300 [Plakobranchus ocellatus]|uniref:Uncharacterized protein n=1 Tax=Plakobranchus ocellatus TaxID=259542 RepID=A0AAV4D5H4_9GAST|nr:hypothetical protein PoB_006588300 [Plakobranchus ocellatus]